MKKTPINDIFNTQTLILSEYTLRSVQFIQKTESLENVFSSPFTQLKQRINNYFESIQNEDKLFEGTLNLYNILYDSTLLNLLSGLYCLQNQSINTVCKHNTNYFIGFINQELGKRLSNYFLMLFNWDFNRRAWINNDNDFRKAYIKKRISEIKQELEGKKEDILYKYINLLLDLVSEVIDTILKSSILSLNNDELNIKLLMIRNAISDIQEKENLNEYLSVDFNSDFLSLYKPAAQRHLNGIDKAQPKLGFLFQAFVNAQSQYTQILKSCLKSTSEIKQPALHKLKKAFSKQDIELAINTLNAILTSVPNVLIKNTNEAYYHTYIHIILKLVGFEIESELSTNIGRIDLVLRIENFIYIMEFKMESAEQAIKQIQEREYYKRFLNEDKTILLLGIAFNKKERTINKDFILEPLPSNFQP